MNSKAALFVFAIGGHGSHAQSMSFLQTRIVNGSLVSSPSHTYPYFVLPTSGATSDEWLGCGASIISPTFALTSAHCFGGGNSPCQGPSSLAVWVGDLSLSNFHISPKQGAGMRHFRSEATLICSDLFDGKCSHGNDVALLRLSDPVPSWVTPVPLNLDGDGADAVHETVRSMGFGVTESLFSTQSLGSTSEDLRHVDITVLPQDGEHCRRLYDNGWGCSDTASEMSATNLEHQICAGAMPDQTERDTCSGDSGSPMIDAKGRQVGIVSYGGGPGGNAGPGRMCGDRDYPGIYARVSAFASFLREHVTDLP